MLCVGALLLSPAGSHPTPGGAPELPVDSWGPFADRRVVSASGRHYAVLRARKGVWPGPFELLRRRDGAPPVEPARAGDRFETGPDGAQRRVVILVDPDSEDRLLAEGILPQLPMDAAVCDEPLGIVLFDKYANVGYGQTLTFLGAEGEPEWAHTLEELFGREPPGTTHTVSSRWWSSAFGVDEELGIAWVLSRGGEFRAVTLGAGEISTPGAEDIAWLCARGSAENRAAAMDAVIAGEEPVTREFLPALQPVAFDEREPLAVRLRAAVLCRRAGDPVDYSEWFMPATRAKDLDDAWFAALHLSEITSVDEPLEPLVQVMSRLEQPLDPREELGAIFDRGPRLPALVAAFRREGDAGRVRLERLLEDERPTPAGLISAGVVWWKLGGVGLPTRLRRQILWGNSTVANQALNAMIYSEPAGLNDILLELAREGTADDVRLALWFREHPHPDAVEPLERMLAKLPDDSWEARVMREALEACKR
jgi:hypothetical protein